MKPTAEFLRHSDVNQQNVQQDRVGAKNPRPLLWSALALAIVLVVLAAGGTVAYNTRPRSKNTNLLPDRVEVLSASITPKTGSKLALLKLSLRLTREDGNEFTSWCGLGLTDLREGGQGALSDFIDSGTWGGKNSIKTAKVECRQGLLSPPTSDLPLRVHLVAITPVYTPNWWERWVLGRKPRPSNVMRLPLPNDRIVVPVN